MVCLLMILIQLFSRNWDKIVLSRDGNGITPTWKTNWTTIKTNDHNYHWWQHLSSTSARIWIQGLQWALTNLISIVQSIFTVKKRQFLTCSESICERLWLALVIHGKDGHWVLHQRRQIIEVIRVPNSQLHLHNKHRHIRWHIHTKTHTYACTKME